MNCCTRWPLCGADDTRPCPNAGTGMALERVEARPWTVTAHAPAPTPPTAHTPLKHTGCEEPYCNICEGGLVICAVCGGAEGSLPKHCPGAKMTADQESAVYAGRLDFADGQWVGEIAPALQLPPEPARTAPTDERDPVRVQVGCSTCRGSGFTGHGQGYDDVCSDCAGNPTWTEAAMVRVWRDGDRYFVWIYDGDGGVVKLESPPAESATPNLDALGDLPW